MNEVRENALHVRECFLGLLISLMYLAYRKQGEILKETCALI